MKKLFALLLALVMALSLVACGEKKDDTEDKTDDSNPSTGMELTQATDLVIATGGTSGAWYPIGVSIADTLTNVDNNLFVTSEVTNGGVENARLLGTHAANVGFVNSDTAYFATQSEDAFASEPPRMSCTAWPTCMTACWRSPCWLTAASTASRIWPVSAWWWAPRLLRLHHGLDGAGHLWSDRQGREGL